MFALLLFLCWTAAYFVDRFVRVVSYNLRLSNMSDLHPTLASIRALYLFTRDTQFVYNTRDKARAGARTSAR